MLNPPVNGKIQGLFKAFECFSSTFQGKFYFLMMPNSDPMGRIFLYNPHMINGFFFLFTL